MSVRITPRPPTSHSVLLRSTPSSHVPLRPPTSHSVLPRATPSSHAPLRPPTRHSVLPRANPHRINIRIHIHFLFRNLYAPCIRDAASSRLHPIVFQFFCHLFRKVYALSNGMHLFLPIDRFLRTRSRDLLMYLNPVVSLSVSSFDLVTISSLVCSVPVVPILFLVSRSHVTLSQYLCICLQNPAWFKPAVSKPTHQRIDSFYK